MNDFCPAFRRKFLRVFAADFHVFDEVEQQIDRALLSCRPVLIYDRMNGHRRVNARQFLPPLIVSQGLHNRDGTVLTILRIPSPPNNSKDLTRMEVVNALSLALFVLIGRRAKAQALKAGVWNVSGNETG
jgi:hypothetical protein